MSLEDAALVRELLLEARGSSRHVALQDALWLRPVLIEQAKQTPHAERRIYERQADAILARLLELAGPNPHA